MSIAFKKIDTMNSLDYISEENTPSNMISQNTAGEDKKELNFENKLKNVSLD